MNHLDLLGFFGFIVLISARAIYSSRTVNSESAYVLASKSTGLFALLTTLVMTEFNPSTLIGFSGAGYFAGVYGICLPLVFLIGLGFYCITVAKKWKELGATSVAELFTIRYGRVAGKLASSLLILAMLGFSANYIKSLELLFSPIFPEIKPILISILIVLLILFLCGRGGLISIIQVDIISFLATLVFIPLLLYFSWKNTNLNFETALGAIPIETGMEILKPKFVFSLVILTMFTYIAAPWYGQKIFSAESPKVAIQAVGLASVSVFLFYSIPVLSTLMLKSGNVKLVSPDEGIPYIIKNLFPNFLRGFSYAVLFSAGATTLAGVWSAISGMIVVDILDSKLKEEGIKRTFLIQTLIGIISLFISQTFIDKILDKLILANIPIAALSYGLLAGFYSKSASKIGFYISSIFGIFIGIYSYLNYPSDEYTFIWAVFGIPGIFLSGIIGSKFFPRRSD
ncbi:MAG: hypothetical protein SFU98_01445 [Leptospiraceae bacterium]|nr:hypothetical protein [Leptospiraceae bacterium]